MGVAKFIFQQQYLASHLLFYSVTFSQVSLNSIFPFNLGWSYDSLITNRI